MKKQFLNFAAFMLVVSFAACKSTTTATPTSTASKASTGNQKKGQRPNMEERFVEMDVNNDGKLSESEVKGPIKDNFSTIDTDKDGFLSKEELKNAPKPERGSRGRQQY